MTIDTTAQTSYFIDMPNSLSIKLSLGDFHLQLEGSADTVSQQFNHILTNGLGKLANLPPKSAQPASPQSPQPIAPSTPSLSLHDVVHKNIPHTEAEWILVFGHFITQTPSKQSFTRKDLLSMYRTSKLYTRNRSKGLTGTITAAIKQNWIRSLNDTELVITDTGQTKLNSLLSL